MSLAHSSLTIAGKPVGVAVANASGLNGLDAYGVQVEVCCTRGPAFFQMVGLAEVAVRESRVRMASALARLGVLLDEYAITVNLAPAGIKKTSTALDFALAIGVLAALGRIPGAALEQLLLLGELSLEGNLRPIRGVLPQLGGAHLRGIGAAIVPAANRAEAGLISDLVVYEAPSLAAAVQHLSGQQPLTRVPPLELPTEHSALAEADLSDVRGQAAAKRALEVAAAGGHNLLMIGHPGAGKTMLARMLPTLLPKLALEEALETTAIHSVAGLVDPEQGVVTVRPFRAPHHSISEAGLVGGGVIPRPGDVSLAHHGVLFLDELPEFRRSALEALRGPLEDGRVSITRARAAVNFPARPMLIAAMNPCPCGYYLHPTRRCRCSPAQVQRYRARVSGPLVDRLDVHVSLPPVDIRSLTAAHGAESSAEVRRRVTSARELQLTRFRRGLVRVKRNAELAGRELEQLVVLDRASKRLLEAAVEGLGLSARAYTKILRVARTIADLAESERVLAEHVVEAIQARLLDREAPL